MNYFFNLRFAKQHKSRYRNLKKLNTTFFSMIALAKKKKFILKKSIRICIHIFKKVLGYKTTKALFALIGVLFIIFNTQ